MFRFGADYYPEHWPEARWPEDARLMADAGFNVVRLAEFAWALMEPQDGRFDFAWLDRAIETVSAHGMQVVLGTPTASPPPWLMCKQEDLYLVQKNGVRLTYGLRREYCPNNALYHEYSARIVAQMAGRYGDNPAVIGWQIDNEFGDRCYCKICQGRFQSWLDDRHGSLDEVNRKWGTVFWGHIYTEWSQIPTALDTARSHNPGLNLDYYRFMSDSYRAFQKMQIDIIRESCPQQFITHNLMGFNYPLLNNYDMTEDLDFVSWDNYWRMQWNMETAVKPSSAALGHDTMRGLKKKNFWVMEQQSGGGGWEMVAVPPKPGELRLWTYQSIAHGADGIVYFRWRTCRHGTEQYWHGILDHHGVPGRRYAETVQVGQELQEIGDLVEGSSVHCEAAIMQSYDTRFAFQVQPNNPSFQYERHIQDLYDAFFDLNVALDVISEKDSLEGYRVVIVPAMYVLTAETASSLEQFAASGGIVVFTPRTGVKDQDNAVVNMRLPGLVARMSGVEVEEYVSMPPDGENKIQFALPNLEEEFAVAEWADVLKPDGAHVVAHYQDDYYGGKAAITINPFGKGNVIYLGTMGDVSYYQAMAAWISNLAGIEPLMVTPEGVEAVKRVSTNGSLLFLMNHTDSDQALTLGGEYRDLLQGETAVSGEIILAATDVRVLLKSSDV